MTIVDFDDIRYFNDKKILNINLIKNKKDIDISRFVNFKKTGKNYYLLIDQEQIQMDLDNNTEAFIDDLIDKNITYLAKLKDLKTIKIIMYSIFTKKMDLLIFIENKTEKILKDYKSKYIFEENEGIDCAILGYKSEEDEWTFLGKETQLFFKYKVEIYYENKKKKEAKVFSAIKERNIQKNDLKGYKFFLIKGKIKILNNSKEAINSAKTEIEIEEIKNSSETYLNLWNEYADFEKQITLTNVIKNGYFKIEDAKYIKKDGKEIFVLSIDKNRKNIFSKGDTLNIIDKEPKELANIKSIEDYIEVTKSEISYETTIEKISSKKEIWIEQVNGIDSSNLKESYLFLSLTGDKTVYDRRERARAMILDGKSGIKDLSILIEGKSLGEKKSRSYDALSLETKKSLFPKYNPTETQKKAIEIALNTPDIALIQGPPGTGKTTVITAILQRLNEIKKMVGNISGTNLITSFQHDAVSNATSRVKVLGLPAEKYGQKSGTDGKVLNNIFRQYITENLLKFDEPKLQKLKEEKEFLELLKYYDSIEKAPEKRSIKKILNKLNSFANKYNLSEILKSINELERDIDEVNKDYYFIDKKFIYKLPTSNKMLADNGVFFIKKTIEILKNSINKKEITRKVIEEELNFLEKSYTNISNNKEIEYKKIKLCKTSLISKLTPVEETFICTSENEKIKEIFEKIKLYSEEIKTTNKDRKNNLKVKYMEELKNNPLRVRDTLRSYITTFGATCQQTQGKYIKEAKNNNDRCGEKNNYELKKWEKYENVLIDEAARSNPPDLLIPMCMATERIILVGDHKQLPHLIDENILDYIKDDNVGVNDSLEKDFVLKTSMFEFLIKRCEELEKQDKIKRMIMLDTQYRMHPQMGTFVSENFYEGNLKNGLPANQFVNKLKGFEGKAYAWLDIPYSDEYKEKTEKNSTYRNIEAKEIAKFIYTHIDSKEAIGKNFGIITFYAKQREEILKELANPENRMSDTQRIAVKKTEKGYKILNYYAFSNEDGIDEKLKVGSVDAFQGMEFDYVCLSMVRSNSLPLYNEKNLRRKFGFLTNPNRLCVAMSRQKEFIIMFGDSKMLETNKYYKDIEPLKNYLNMCKEEGEYGKIECLL